MNSVVPTPLFRLRIVELDYYLTAPLENVDNSYNLLNNSPLDRVPIIRIFGSTPGGQKCCLHVHNVFPYFYVDLLPELANREFVEQIGIALDRALKELDQINSNANAAADDNPSTKARRPHTRLYSLSLLFGQPFYGFSPNSIPFLKIALLDPADIRRAVTLLNSGILRGSNGVPLKFQSHENHIPYLLQFFVDFNLFGMDFIDLSAIQFRSPLPEKKMKFDAKLIRGDSDGRQTQSAQQMNSKEKSSRRNRIEIEFDDENVLNQQQSGEDGEAEISSDEENTEIDSSSRLWLSGRIPAHLLISSQIPRFSTCELECDAQANFILNQQNKKTNNSTQTESASSIIETAANNLTGSDSGAEAGKRLVRSLQSIWETERARRRLESMKNSSSSDAMEFTQLTPEPSQARVRPANGNQFDIAYRQHFNEVADIESEMKPQAIAEPLEDEIPMPRMLASAVRTLENLAAPDSSNLNCSLLSQSFSTPMPIRRSTQNENEQNNSQLSPAINLADLLSPISHQNTQVKNKEISPSTRGVESLFPSTPAILSTRPVFSSPLTLNSSALVELSQILTFDRSSLRPQNNSSSSRFEVPDDAEELRCDELLDAETDEPQLDGNSDAQTELIELADVYGDIQFSQLHSQSRPDFADDDILLPQFDGGGDSETDTAAGTQQSHSSSKPRFKLSKVLLERQNGGATEYFVQLVNLAGEETQKIWVAESRIKQRQDLIRQFRNNNNQTTANTRTHSAQSNSVNPVPAQRKPRALAARRRDIHSSTSVETHTVSIPILPPRRYKNFLTKKKSEKNSETATESASKQPPIEIPAAVEKSLQKSVSDLSSEKKTRSVTRLTAPLAVRSPSVSAAASTINPTVNAIAPPGVVDSSDSCELSETDDPISDVEDQLIYDEFVLSLTPPIEPNNRPLKSSNSIPPLSESISMPQKSEISSDFRSPNRLVPATNSLSRFTPIPIPTRLSTPISSVPLSAIADSIDNSDPANSTAAVDSPSKPHSASKAAPFSGRSPFSRAEQRRTPVSMKNDKSNSESNSTRPKRLEFIDSPSTGPLIETPNALRNEAAQISETNQIASSTGSFELGQIPANPAPETIQVIPNSMDSNQFLSPIRTPNVNSAIIPSTVVIPVPSTPSDLLVTPNSSISIDFSLLRSRGLHDPQSDALDMGSYMQEKRKKTRVQWAVEAGSSVGSLFAGMKFWLNGRTRPPANELRNLIYSNGGTMENVLIPEVTHIIAEQLPASKIAEFKNSRAPRPVLMPNWIVQCAQQKKILDSIDFILPELRKANSNNEITKFISPSIISSSAATKVSSIDSTTQPLASVDQPIRSILLVCFANHCRSPLAEGVMKFAAASSGIPRHQFLIESRGTNKMSSRGAKAHPASVKIAAAHGISIENHQAKLLVQEDFTRFQLILVMDRKNLLDVQRFQPTNSTALVRLFMPDQTEIDDPFNKGDAAYKRVFDQLSANANYWITALIEGKFTEIKRNSPFDKQEKTEIIQLANVSKSINSNSITQETNQSTVLKNPIVSKAPIATRYPQAANSVVVITKPAPSTHSVSVSDSNSFGPRSTLTDPDFVSNYLRASRLHFIGAWKLHFQQILPRLKQIQPRFANSARSASSSRFIFHIDMDCFFVSVSQRLRPETRGKPVVVCHSKNSTSANSGSVSSASYEARSFGIGAETSIGEAIRRCPDLIVLPYDFDSYCKSSDEIYEIFYQFSHAIESVSLDEAYIEFSPVESQNFDPLEIAKQIRAEIFKRTECCASVGIGESMIAARIATKLAKPNGIQRLRTANRTTNNSSIPSNCKDFLTETESMNCDVLPGIGWQGAKKLLAANVKTIGDIRKSTKNEMQKLLGAKNGATIFDLASGIDHRTLAFNRPPQSLAVDINWGVRFETVAQVNKFIGDVARELIGRLKTIRMKSSAITVKAKKKADGAGEPWKFLGHGWTNDFSKSIQIAKNSPIRGDEESQKSLTKIAVDLFSQLAIEPELLRGFGIVINKLESDEQQSTAASGESVRDSWKTSEAEWNRQIRDSKRFESERRTLLDGGESQSSLVSSNDGNEQEFNFRSFIDERRDQESDFREELLFDEPMDEEEFEEGSGNNEAARTIESANNPPSSSVISAFDPTSRTSISPFSPPLLIPSIAPKLKFSMAKISFTPVSEFESLMNGERNSYSADVASLDWRHFSGPDTDRDYFSFLLTRPPDPKLIAATFGDFGLPSVIHQRAFYSDPVHFTQHQSSTINNLAVSNYPGPFGEVGRPLIDPPPNSRLKHHRITFPDLPNFQLNAAKSFPDPIPNYSSHLFRKYFFNPAAAIESLRRDNFSLFHCNIPPPDPMIIAADVDDQNWGKSTDNKNMQANQNSSISNSLPSDPPISSSNSQSQPNSTAVPPSTIHSGGTQFSSPLDDESDGEETIRPASPKHDESFLTSLAYYQPANKHGRRGKAKVRNHEKYSSRLEKSARASGTADRNAHQPAIQGMNNRDENMNYEKSGRNSDELNGFDANTGRLIPTKRKIDENAEQRKKQRSDDPPASNNSSSVGQSVQEATLRALAPRQHITIVSVEIHSSSRGLLQSDPKFDPVLAILIAARAERHGESRKSPDLTAVLVLQPNQIPVLGHQQNANASSAEIPKEFQVSREFPCDYYHEYSDELQLFDGFSSIIRRLDPDILIGYETQKASFGYILDRGKELGRDLSTDLGRILSNFDAETNFKRAVKRDKAAENNPAVEYSLNQGSNIKFTGRIVLNLWRILRDELKLCSYSFENVCYHVLKIRFPAFAQSIKRGWWNYNPLETIASKNSIPQSSSGRYRAISYYLSRALANFSLVESLDLIGRTSELARVFGIKFFNVLDRGSQFRVESLMLRLCKAKNFIVPALTPAQRNSQPAMECLPLIMEPISQFYHSPVVVLDFQSLYPSMMIAYNICYSTCLGKLPSKMTAREKSAEGKFVYPLGGSTIEREGSLLKGLADDIFISPNGVLFVKDRVRRGILPQMLNEILTTRIMVKQTMKRRDAVKNKPLLRVLNARQFALKLIANVTYGYTAAGFSGRMPCAEIADSIVAAGRQTLENAINLVESTEKWHARVVYGDTDSLFVLLDGRSKADAFRIGHEIAAAVTAANPKPVKLQMDKVFLPSLLVAKKRYVGLKYESANGEGVLDCKGLEMVRRDGCPLLVRVQEQVLNTLFETRDLSAVRRLLESEWSKIWSGNIRSVDEFIFAKEVRLGSYRQPPIAALIALQAMKEDIRAAPLYSERVPYLIVDNAIQVTLREKAISPQQFLANPQLYRLSASYYIEKVLIPPIQRILQLTGCDVPSWFVNWPRPRKRLFTVPEREINRSAPGNNSFDAFLRSAVVPGRRTIDQYYASRHCPMCDTIIEKPPLGFCARCINEPARLHMAVMEALNEAESAAAALARVCHDCMGSSRFPAVSASSDGNPLSSVACSSLDCNVYYSRYSAREKLQLAQHCMELLEKVHKHWEKRKF